MNYWKTTSCVLLSILIFSIVGCQGKVETDSISEIKPIDIEPPELFIDFEQKGMVQPVSIEFLGENRLAILDGKLNEVFVFDTSGSFHARFGGEGKGPGEFLRPLYLNKTQHYINVIDAGLNRVTQFDSSGSRAGIFNFKENPYTTNLTIMGAEKYVAGALGENKSLIKIVDRGTGSTSYFGTPKAENMGKRVNIIEEARKSLSNGEIPAMFKNDVKLTYDGNHIYVFLSAYSQLQKYNAGGDLIWKTDINLPINESIFDNLVERAKSAKPSTVPSFQYITSMKVANGMTYLLWAPAEGYKRKMVKVDADGNIVEIYNIPDTESNFFDLTVDPQTESVYLAAPGMGQIYRAELTPK